MNYIMMPHEHAEDVAIALHLHNVNVRMARTDAPAKDLETGRLHVEVAE